MVPRAFQPRAFLSHPLSLSLSHTHTQKHTHTHTETQKHAHTPIQSLPPPLSGSPILSSFSPFLALFLSLSLYAWLHMGISTSFGMLAMHKSV